MSLSPSNQACLSVHHIRHVRRSIREGMSVSPKCTAVGGWGKGRGESGEGGGGQGEGGGGGVNSLS